MFATSLPCSKGAIDSQPSCQRLKEGFSARDLPKAYGVQGRRQFKAQRAIQHDPPSTSSHRHSLASRKVTSIAIDHLVIRHQCRRDIQLVLVRLTRVKRPPGCVHGFVCAECYRRLSEEQSKGETRTTLPLTSLHERSDVVHVNVCRFLIRRNLVV
jgi:hypothetical protein